MTLTDIKRPQAIAVLYKYLVYQALWGVSVSQGTLCLMTPHILGTSLRTRVCQSGMWDTGPDDEGGGTHSDWLGEKHHTLHERPGPCARTLSAGEYGLLTTFVALIMDRERERRATVPEGGALPAMSRALLVLLTSPASEPCTLVREVAGSPEVGERTLRA